jgi:hypothetical protein
MTTVGIIGHGNTQSNIHVVHACVVRGIAEDDMTSNRSKRNWVQSRNLEDLASVAVPPYLPVTCAGDI